MPFFVVDVVRTESGYVESIFVFPPCETSEEAERHASKLLSQIHHVIVEAEDERVAAAKALDATRGK